MEFVATEVRRGGGGGGDGAKLKGAGGSQGSGSATPGSGSSSVAAAASDGVAKRRKVDFSSSLERECGDASVASACVVQFERCEVAEEEVNSPAVGESFGAPVEARTEDERCLSVDLEDPGSASCCSSNESSEVAKKISELVDLEVKSEEVDPTAIQSSFKSERQTHDEAAGADSDSDENNTPKPPAAANSHRRQLRARMPTQDEIDDFFSTTEANTAVRFKAKYNFDFEKEAPLKGRYEWKPLIPAANDEKIIKA